MFRQAINIELLDMQRHRLRTGRLTNARTLKLYLHAPGRHCREQAMSTTHERLIERRRSLEREIYAAFEGVSRAGCISWRDAEDIDDVGGDFEPFWNRGLDPDSEWPQLLSSSNWNPDQFGHWCYLDPGGFKYYIAPAMIWYLNNSWSWTLAGVLREDGPAPKRNSPTTRFSLLNSDQRRCIAGFLWFKTVYGCDLRVRDERSQGSGIDTETHRWNRSFESEIWLPAIRDVWRNDLESWLEANDKQYMEYELTRLDRWIRNGKRSEGRR